VSWRECDHQTRTALVGTVVDELLQLPGEQFVAPADIVVRVEVLNERQQTTTGKNPLREDALGSQKLVFLTGFWNSRFLTVCITQSYVSRVSPFLNNLRRSDYLTG
jgi:hypothetical protein